MRQAGAIARLILLNGLRVAMGGWAQHDRSKLHARALALALARTHLGTGYDAVIPQYLGRTDFIDDLEAVAAELGASFHHLLLNDGHGAVAQRFRSRRSALHADGSAHPQADVADDEIDRTVADAQRRLADLAASRAGISVVDVAADDAYDRMITMLR